VVDKETTEALVEFFGGCFNEDWSLDSLDWQSAVRDFFKEAWGWSGERFARVHRGIESLLSSDYSESDLKSKVIDEFGSYYLVSADGMSFRQWLTELNKLIENLIRGGGLPPVYPPGPIDISKLDLKQITKEFYREERTTPPGPELYPSLSPELEKLRGEVNSALAKMVRLNKTRIDYFQVFQQMSKWYNEGIIDKEEFFHQLISLAQGLKWEDSRKIREGLTEEELAVFDLITKPNMKLTKKEKATVKKVAKDLLETLKNEKLVIDWRKFQATRASVRVAIKDALQRLPDKYTDDIFQKKVDVVYQHIFESYYGQGRSVYAEAGPLI